MTDTIFFLHFAWNMISLLFPGPYEVVVKTGKSEENQTEIRKSVISTLLGMFQNFQNCFCFYSSINGWGLLVLWTLWKTNEKNYKLWIFSKSRRESKKKICEQNHYHVKFYVCSPNFVKIGPQAFHSIPSPFPSTARSHLILLPL